MNKRDLLKEHCLDSMWNVLLAVVILAAPIYAYWPRSFVGDSSLYVFRIYALRILAPLAIVSFCGCLIGDCRRCIMGLIDLWKKDEVQGVFTVYRYEYSKFNISSKKGYFEIQPKMYSKFRLIDLNAWELKALYLDERVCNNSDFDKIKKNLKHGEKYVYTAFRYSKIITSVAVAQGTELCVGLG